LSQYIKLKSKYKNALGQNIPLQICMLNVYEFIDNYTTKKSTDNINEKRRETVVKKTTTKANFDVARIAMIGQKIRALCQQLKDIFPEREVLIEQIMYALLTREHVLVTGPYGTGKSDLFSTLMDCIEGAQTFRIGMSKFMSEAAIFGVPNSKVLRESGKVEYDPESGILCADFAELDEILDSSPPLLRTLLGVLNEKQWKRGHVITPAKLHTAVASTNGYPEEEISRNPTLGAVIDRFLFRCKIEYLREGESRRRMYRKYLNGQKPDIKITLAELQEISEIVVSANQITDDRFIDIYDRVIQEYRDTLGKDEVVSDRRACKLLQLIEASALLYGRYDVHYTDIYAIKHGLCYGDEDKIGRFTRASEPIIEEAKKQAKQNVDEAEVKLLKKYQGEIPGTIDESDDQALLDARRKLIKLKEDVDAVKPQLSFTEDLKNQVHVLILRKMDEVQRAIDYPKPSTTTTA